MEEKGSYRRNDALAKVTGTARFTDDIKLPGMLHCVPVYHDGCVHGKILSIDGLEEATSRPGVRRVLCHRDVPGELTFGQIFKDYAMLAKDKIRCEGDVIALVVADSPAEALAASRCITLQLEELPPLYSPEEALRKEAPLIHPSHGSNIINRHQIRRGKEIDAALEECDLVLERQYNTAAVEHVYLEPESALCIPRPDGVMEVHAGVQHPFSTRRFIAALLGCPLSEVEILGTPMGGGFGGKDDTISIVAARTALAAQLCGKPVKMTYTREWSIRESYKRHPYRMNYHIGLKDRKIHGVKVEIQADGGAYASVTPWVTWRSTVQCCGPYRVENVHCDATGVYTNNVFTGAFRGFGAPQVNFAVEQWVEECAEALEMDPLEFRRLNMLRQDDETVTAQKLDNHKVSLEEVMDRALELSDYLEKRRKNSRGQGPGPFYGIGMAISYRGCSLGAEGMDFCPAIINGQFDGSILLDVGIHENGQGSETAMIRILSQELGVKEERIRYNRPSTSRIPDGGSTVASRGTLMGGGAVVNAAGELKKKLSHCLQGKLGCSPEEVQFHHDRIWGKDPSRSLGWDEAMQEMFLLTEYPFAFGHFQAPKVSWDEENGRGKAYFTWGYSCQIVELEVSGEKGPVKLLGAYAVHDAGRVINPQMIRGQVYGGFLQGYGMACMEDLNIQKGRIGHKNLNRYTIPRASDSCDMLVDFIENPDPQSPSGAKGIGEPALEIAAAATANALRNALGKGFHFYPFFPKGDK